MNHTDYNDFMASQRKKKATRNKQHTRSKKGKDKPTKTPAVRSKITSQSSAEDLVNALRELDERFHLVLTLSPAVIYVCGPAPDHPTMFISDNVYDKLGYKPDEFYSDANFWTKRIHKDDVDEIMQNLSHVENKDYITYEYRLRHRDGHYIWFHDQLSLVRDDSGKIVMLVGSWFDVTAQKQADLLREGQNRVLESLVKKTTLEQVLTELVYTIEQQAEGMICSVLIFDSINQCLRHGAGPNLPDAYNEAIDGMSIGPNVGSCGTAAHSGKPVIVKDTQSDPLWKDFRDLAKEHGLLACWSQPILDSTNHVLGTFAMYYSSPRGPTESELNLIKQAASLAAIAIERHRAEQALRRSERITSIGTLAAGIAHEINNPITSIILAAQNALNAKNEKTRAERAMDSLQTIVNDAQRCAQIIQSVLQFARNEPTEKWPHDIHELIQRAIELTKYHVESKKAVIELIPANDLPQVTVNPVQIVQVLVNLIQNAADSADTDNKISIHTEKITDMLMITVQDEGRGMTAEQKRHMFDPFFTTRERDGGVGLGMSITHGIITSHGGTIDVISKPGQGSTIIVELPIHQS